MDKLVKLTFACFDDSQVGSTVLQLVFSKYMNSFGFICVLYLPMSHFSVVVQGA